MKKVVIICCLLLLCTVGCIFAITYDPNVYNEPIVEEKPLSVVQDELSKQIYSAKLPDIDENAVVLLNPYNVSPLTALIAFQTTEPTVVKVNIYNKNDQIDISYDFKQANTEHYVPVYGLYADYKNKVELIVNDKSYIYEIKTEKLDEKVVVASKVINNGLKDNNELFFTTPASNGFPTGYDSNGEVRWYLKVMSTWRFFKMDNGHFMIGTDRVVNNPYYNTGVMEIDYLGRIYQTLELSDGVHHDYQFLPNGNLLMASSDFSTGYVEDNILEVDYKTGKIVKRIDMKDIIDKKEGKSVNSIEYDWMHNNSIWYDANTNSLTLSCRHLDSVINLDYKTLKINWIMGDPATYSESMRKYVLKPVDNNFEYSYQQHAAMIMPNGNLFLFDNGNNKSKTIENFVSAQNNYSRGVIYEIDQKNMKFKQVYQYGKERGSSFYSPYISDVDYIDENHYVINSGGIVNKDGQPYNYPAAFGNNITKNCIIVEVKDNNLLYEINLPTNNYRVEKMALYGDTTYPIDVVSKEITNYNKTEVNSEIKGLVVDKVSKDIERYELSVVKEKDRLVFKGKFDKKDKVNVVLKGKNTHGYDWVISNKPYTAMCVDIYNEGLKVTKYIYDEGLRGKYNIYVVVNDEVFDMNLSIKY